jgi:hypothetical protein
MSTVQSQQQPECTTASDSTRTEDVEVREMFRTAWPAITSPTPALFGFRRFRTSHLLNLRILEKEILAIDNTVYQAGWSLGAEVRNNDRLALANAQKDADAKGLPSIDKELITRLRDLLRQYGESSIHMAQMRRLTDKNFFSDDALAAFNQVMTMETNCLSDHKELCARSGLSREETFRTRLVQVDRPVRTGVRDPVQHLLRKLIRRIWFFASKYESETTSLPTNNAANVGSGRWRTTYHTTAWLAEVMSRFSFGLLACAFLTVPMVFLLRQASDRSKQLMTVVICVIIFCLFVALSSQARPQEMMAASAAYAAVLVVFISANDNSGGN